VFIVAVLMLILFDFSCSKVKNPDGSSINHIIITALKPAHGPYDTIDTLIGSGFDQVPNFDSVLINGKKLTLISRNPTQVIVQIPSLSGTGNIDLWYQGKMIQGPVFTYDSTFFVTTIAGSIDPGLVNAQGLDARFNQPRGIAVDPAGNIYVADWGNNSLRKITLAGSVSTLAGSLNGTPGYLDSSGTAALFSAPSGLSIDSGGFLYVGDEFTYRVRKVSLSGVVTTLAGIWWPAGPAGGQVDGDVSVATFDSPLGVAAGTNGEVYVADLYNNKIRKVTPSGTVSTYAGAIIIIPGKPMAPWAPICFLIPGRLPPTGRGTSL
jgi:hypothetical protein